MPPRSYNLLNLRADRPAIDVGKNATPASQPFDSQVWDAAASGSLADFQLAAETKPQLVDAAHPERSGLTPLGVAAARGHVAIVEALLHAGSAAVDAVDQRGWTPMHAAARFGRVAVVVALLRAGSAAIDHPDSDGWTPLYTAAASGQTAVIEELIRAGSAAIDRPSRIGLQPVHVAALCNHKPAVELLLCLGADAARDDFSQQVRAILHRHIDEEKVADVRYRVHFAPALLDKLLVWLN